MPINGYKGGIISATPPTTSVSSASGVWTLDEQLQAGANWPVAPSFVNNSVRLRASATAYLSRTFPTAGNRKKWTWSGWVKRGTLGTAQLMFFSYSSESNTNMGGFQWETDNTLAFTAYSDYVCKTTAVFRDPSAWYHVVVNIDTAQATATNRVKLYINGVEQAYTQYSAFPAQNADLAINQAAGHSIGSRQPYASSQYVDGYITDVNFIDGQALTPNYFGATDAATGVWQPATYRGTYGTNGFYLPMNVGVEGYDVDYLVVSSGAGGGAGYFSGTGGGGGGGAGAQLSYSTNNLFLGGTTYIATVGAGGAPNTTGNESVFLGLSTPSNAGFGSGGGGSPGGSGFNGGGAGAWNGDGSTEAGGVGSSGRNGGATGLGVGGGGGAGLGSAGSNGSNNTGGNGGSGTSNSITGTSVGYCGGGGGGGYTGGSATDGGGDGGSSANGTSGSANRGGGGGGGGAFSTTAGGNGGSGVVILRMLTTNYSGITTGSPTVTTDGSYTVVKYTSSGSYTA